MLDNHTPVSQIGSFVRAYRVPVRRLTTIIFSPLASPTDSDCLEQLERRFKRFVAACETLSRRAFSDSTLDLAIANASRVFHLFADITWASPEDKKHYETVVRAFMDRYDKKHKWDTKHISRLQVILPTLEGSDKVRVTLRGS